MRFARIACDIGLFPDFLSSFGCLLPFLVLLLLLTFLGEKYLLDWLIYLKLVSWFSVLSCFWQFCSFGLVGWFICSLWLHLIWICNFLMLWTDVYFGGIGNVIWRGTRSDDRLLIEYVFHHIKDIAVKIDCFTFYLIYAMGTSWILRCLLSGIRWTMVVQTEWPRFGISECRKSHCHMNSVLSVLPCILW
jgi:hypothetical protein